MSVTQDQVLELVQLYDESGLTTSQIAAKLNIINSSTSYHLKNLIDQNKLIKEGNHPNIFYHINPEYNNKTREIPIVTGDAITDYFGFLDPVGNYLEGLDAFITWKQVQYKGKLTDVELIKQFQLARSEILRDKYSLINANRAIDINFENQRHISNLYLLDVYSLPIFGRMKLALLGFQAKQSKNKILANKLFDNIIPKIQELIARNHYDYIAFIPPSIKREFQLIYALEKELNLTIPKIKVIKYFSSGNSIQQKSLKTVGERKTNAQKTFRVASREKSLTNLANLKCLLIDDFVGSGSSLNIVADKIKSVYPDIVTIDGMAIAGNIAKDFPIIKEM